MFKYYSCGHKYRDTLTCNLYEMVLICFALYARTLNIITLKLIILMKNNKYGIRINLDYDLDI